MSDNQDEKQTGKSELYSRPPHSGYSADGY